MYGQFGKRFIVALLIVSLLGPLVLIFWKPQLGVALFLIGLLIAYRCLRVVRMMQVERTLQEQQAVHRKRNHSQTIFVQLVDDHGNDLPSDIAQTRLADARMQAGPRDTVVGVRRKVP